MNSYDQEQDLLLRDRIRPEPRPATASALVSTAWLAGRIGDPGLAIFEVSTATDPAEGHIPGAIRLDWGRDLLDQVRRDIVGRELLEQILQSAGVTDGTTIVLYGDCHNWFAAFAAWVFEIYGLRDVRLLDGGRAKWVAEDRPLTTRFPRPGFGDVTLAPADPALRARLPEVLDATEGRATTVVVDVRSPEEYAGLDTPADGEGAVRSGHVPGAVNIPWGRLVDRDGTFKPLPELRRIFAAHGIDGRTPVITYCRIGERSGHTWFALNRLLGWPSKNYDGSWAEYGNAIGVPVTNPSR